MAGEHALGAMGDVVDASYRPRLEWNAGVYEYLSKAYGREHFAEICSALTRPSIFSCVRVNCLQTTTKEVLSQLKRHFLGDTDLTGVELKGEIACGKSEGLTKTVTAQAEETACRSRMVVSQVMVTSQDIEPEVSAIEEDEYAQRSPYRCYEHELLDDVIMVRGRGPCEIDYKDLDGDGEILKEVVVSRKCAEAVLRGAHVFVPGVLACSGHVEKGETVAVSVAVERPDGLGGWGVGVTRGTTLSSLHAKSQFEDRERSGWFIGKGRAMMSRSTVFRETKGVAVEMVERTFDLPPFHGLLKGNIFLQNLPSIVAARVLDPKPGERILDMCAAPGGKTTAIAMLMEDKGEIIALDRSHSKVLDIVRLAKEMKLTCIQAIKLDALKSVLTNFTASEGNVSPSSDVESMASSTVSLINIHAGTNNGVTSAELSNVSTDGVSETLREFHLKDAGQASELAPEVESMKRLTIPNEAVAVSSGTTGSKSGPEDKGASASRAQARKEAWRLKTGSGRGLTVDKGLLCIKGFASGSFDRVLLDAPCSALGLRPRLFAGQETLEGLRKHANYQRRLLDQAVQLVRPGGTLVYSTCTMNPGENEGVVRYALDTYPFLSLVPQLPRIGGPGLLGGQDVFDGSTYRRWLKEGEQHMVQRFDPSGPHDTIGFFIAKFSIAEATG